MKKLLIALSLIALIGCTTSNQRLAYNTLNATEKSLISTYDRYLDMVIEGRVKTNDVPYVSRAFNAAQASIEAAQNLAHFDTNAPITSEVLASMDRFTIALKKALEKK